MSRLLTRKRIRLYTRALLVAFFGAFGAMLLASGRTLVTPQGRELGADYAVFYTAGRMVLDGRPGQLFDADQIHRRQYALLGHPTGKGYQAWVYPPYVAVLFAPLAALPYLLSYTVFVLLLIGAVWLSVSWLAELVPLVARDRIAAFAMVVCFYPMMKAIVSGQNTAISLLLITGTLVMLVRGRQVTAGVLLGLLLFKPHFAIPLIGLVLLNRRYLSVLVATGVGGLYYLIGAWLVGWDWPLPFMHAVAVYRPLEVLANGPSLVSFTGAAEWLLGAGRESTAGLVVGGVLSAAVALVLSVVFWKRAGDRQGLIGAFGVAVPGILLLSPHTQFYELGMLALPGVLLADREGRRALLPILLIWLFSGVQLIWHRPIVQPLFLVNLFVFFISFRLLRPKAMVAPIDRAQATSEDRPSGASADRDNG